MAHAQYGQAHTNDKVFNLADTVKGKNPALYRKDPYGHTMYRNSYGKNSPMGWHVDHIKPVSRDGSHSIRNLQALNSSVNMSKGNTLVKRSRHAK
jgi:5-methylcytosine-specific restriction endonuclease McrA